MTKVKSVEVDLRRMERPPWAHVQADGVRLGAQLSWVMGKMMVALSRDFQHAMQLQSGSTTHRMG